MEAIAALTGVWWISKRLFYWETQPMLPVPGASNGDQTELLVLDNQVKRMWNTEFRDIMGDIDINRPIDADDELKDDYWPMFARNEIIQPKARTVDVGNWNAYWQ